MDKINFFYLSLSVIFLISTRAWAQEDVQVFRIKENSNIRSDRRPISVGFYDDSIKKTFISWMGANSQPVVISFDHTTNIWSPAKTVGSPPFVDKHNYPGLLKGSNDHLYLFYGCHNSTLKMAVSPDPLSIEGVWKDQFINEAEKASYPAPIVTTEGIFYVFYRYTRKTNGYSDDRPYQMVKSSDQGKTWNRQMIVDPFPRSTDNMTEIYNGKVSYQPAREHQKAKIHLSWTICGEKLGKHSHATYGRNLYYAYLSPENDHLYNIKGADLGKTIDNSEMDNYCLVLDTGIPEKGHMAGLQVSVHYLDNGYPLIHFLDARSDGGSSSATWDGTEWIFSKITAFGGDPRGLEKLGSRAFRVYRPKGREIKVFKTLDGGRKWVLETTISVGKGVDRVNVIDNYNRDAKLLITESGDGSIKEAKRDVFIGKVLK